MNLLIIGASGHAKVIIDIVEKEGKHQLVGLIDAKAQKGDTHFGYPLLGTEADLPAICKAHDVTAGIIAIGDNWIRQKVRDKLLHIKPDFQFATAVHPTASIGKGTQLGPGTVVMAGAIINPDCAVGEHCIVNTNASLDHDSVMGDFASLAPGAVTGGGVTIGAFSAISLGVKVIHGITIGAHTVVGAGATVFKDLGDQVIALGTPARVAKRREIGSRYL